MKTQSVLIISVFFIFISSCIEDGDFKVPENLHIAETTEVQKIEEALNNTDSSLDSISIKGLKNLFVRGRAIEITTDLVVVGYVASSDKSGNFFKEIFIQDKVANAQFGIKIALDLTNTHNKYNLGRKVYVKLKGLFVGETRFGDGIITLGAKNDNLVKAVSLTEIDAVIFRSTETKQLVPRKITLSEIGSSNIGTLIKIENVQFLKELIDEDLSFTDAKERFDTERVIRSCLETELDSVILETSSFADFKFAPLPKNRFLMQAIVTKTFNGSDLVLVLNAKNDIVETGNRCD